MAAAGREQKEQAKKMAKKNTVAGATLNQKEEGEGRGRSRQAKWQTVV